MRQLTPLPSGSVDTVFAICNLFDAVSDSDRLRTLAEVRRVLASGGLLVFSAHNRNSTGLADGPRLQFSRNPITQLRYVVEHFQARANHRRIKPHERFETDYALLNDSAHNYAVLHYYISKESQAKQLAGSGFRLLECLDETGRPLGPNADDRASSCIHYVARRED
jgi:SAM-dependent methyltransferase